MNYRNTIFTLLNQRHISTSDVKKKLELGQTTIIDLNPYMNWKNGHVPGALHLNPENLTQDDLPSDKSSEVIFYCSNPLCRKAPNAVNKALAMGYQNVRVMSAGIKGWISEGLPIEYGA